MEIKWPNVAVFALAIFAFIMAISMHEQISGFLCAEAFFERINFLVAAGNGFFQLAHLLVQLRFLDAKRMIGAV